MVGWRRAAGVHGRYKGTERRSTPRAAIPTLEKEFHDSLGY